jgi:hypothetical protein
MKRIHIAFTLVMLILSYTNCLAQNNNLDESGKNEFENSTAYKRLSVGFNGAYSLAMLNNSTVSKLTEWSSINKFSFIPSLEIGYLVSKNLGIGTGLRFGNYTSGFSIKNFSMQLEKEFIDQDMDAYYPVYENIMIDEVNTFKTIDVPLYVRYQFINYNLTYFASLGAILSANSRFNYSLDGTLTRKGYYPEYNAILNGYPEYNFDDLSYNQSNIEQLKTSGFGVSGFVSLGIMYNLAPDIAIKVGVLGTIGFSDIRPDIANEFNDFHTSTYLGKTTVNSTAIELGVVYKLMNK